MPNKKRSPVPQKHRQAPESGATQPGIDTTNPKARVAGSAPRGGVRSWIFVSHSHKDFEEVRKVRDALEERGHFPLLFFLKCLSDESELESLLRREIKARDFFLLCNSENAATSRFVADEVSYIKSLPGKIYETVDLKSNWNAQLEAIDALSRRATVYLSYSAADHAAAAEIATALAQRDFKIEGLDHNLEAGDDPVATVKRNVLEALRYGFVLVLLSSEAVRRKQSFQWLEVHEAFKSMMHFEPGRPRIIPVILSDHDVVTEELASVGFGDVHALDLSRVDSRDRATSVVEYLLKAALGG